MNLLPTSLPILHLATVIASLTTAVHALLVALGGGNITITTMLNAILIREKPIPTEMQILAELAAREEQENPHLMLTRGCRDMGRRKRKVVHEGDSENQ